VGRKRVESGSEVNRSEPNPNQTSRESAREETSGGTEATSPIHLQPKQPPGQRSRKARRFGDQIRRLHAEGYSLDSIRETLADAGVVVSKSTVQREAARRAPSQPAMAAALPQPERTAPAVHRSVSASPNIDEPLAAPPRQSGREIAEAFFQAHISNPLIRKDTR
jgi:hypothetical protein